MGEVEALIAVFFSCCIEDVYIFSIYANSEPKWSARRSRTAAMRFYRSDNTDRFTPPGSR